MARGKITSAQGTEIMGQGKSKLQREEGKDKGRTIFGKTMKKHLLISGVIFLVLMFTIMEAPRFVHSKGICNNYICVPENCQKVCETVIPEPSVKGYCLGDQRCECSYLC